MMKLKMTDDESGTPEKGFHKMNVSTKKYLILNPNKLFYCLVSALIVLALLIMSIRSEIYSYQTSQTMLNLKNQVKELEEWKSTEEEKQKQASQNILNKKNEENELEVWKNTQEEKQNQASQTLLNLKNEVKELEVWKNNQEEKLNQASQTMLNLKDQIKELEVWKNSQEDKQNSTTQKLIDVEKQGNGYALQIQKHDSKIEFLEKMEQQPTQLVQDSINQKITLAIQQLKLDILNGQVEDKLNQSLMKQSLESLKTQMTEFNELKISFALSKQEIQRLQTDFAPILIEIAELAPIKVEILNIKQDIIHLQSAFNEQIKQVSCTLGNTGSQTTSSGQNSSSTTGSTSSPTSTSTQTPTEDDQYQPQIYGPFFQSNWNQYIYSNSGKFQIYSTTEACILTVNKRAVITLIATGLGACHGCHGQGTFMKNRINHLQETNYKNYFSGAYNIYSDWNPINLTQEFIVEAGTYEFTLWFGHIDTSTVTIEIKSLSFVAKVMY